MVKFISSGYLLIYLVYAKEYSQDVYWPVEVPALLGLVCYVLMFALFLVKDACVCSVVVNLVLVL